MLLIWNKYSQIIEYLVFPVCARSSQQQDQDCNDMLGYAANYGLSQPAFVIIEMLE